MRSVPALLCSLALAFHPAAFARSAEPIRLVVLTDISSLTAGVAEPDDGQSLIRLMLYANEFEIEALVATSNLGHGRKTHPELIRQVVDAYGAVQPNLVLHDGRFPAARLIRETIKAGQPVAGLKVPVEQSIGDGKDTEASEQIIRVADRPDPRPVWVVVWGGSADLAQALWKVRKSRSRAELDRFQSRLRVHLIGDQDSTGPWIRQQFPNLYTIAQERAYRGMYRGGDKDLASSAWVRAHIHGHGRLGNLYPDYDGGDIWSSKIGPVRGIKEGDTPSFLSLAPNGLSDPDNPGLGSWGGRFEFRGKHGIDVADNDLDPSGDLDPRMSSVYRWRPAFQADFQARLDWCVKSYARANHPPSVQLAGRRERSAKPGEVVRLDADGTVDPDGNALSFEWTIYPVVPGGAEPITIAGHNTKNARFVASPRLIGKTVPILLSVSDQGTPRLTRYARVLIAVGKPE